MALPCSHEKLPGKKEAVASVSKVPNSVPIRLLGWGEWAGGRGCVQPQAERTLGSSDEDLFHLLCSITLTTRLPEK